MSCLAASMTNQLCYKMYALQKKLKITKMLMDHSPCTCEHNDQAHIGVVRILCQPCKKKLLRTSVYLPFDVLLLLYIAGTWTQRVQQLFKYAYSLYTPFVSIHFETHTCRVSIHFEAYTCRVYDESWRIYSIDHALHMFAWPLRQQVNLICTNYD